MKTNNPSYKNLVFAAVFGVASLLSSVATASDAVRGGFVLAMAGSAPSLVDNNKNAVADKSLMDEGERKARAALRSARISADATVEASGNETYRTELANALRGERRGARQIAVMYRDGTNGLAANAHRAQQWLQVAADLGCGDSSWQVAQLYNAAGLVGEAAKFEAKAVAIGFRVPARLPSKSMNI